MNATAEAISTIDDAGWEWMAEHSEIVSRLVECLDVISQRTDNRYVDLVGFSKFDAPLAEACRIHFGRYKHPDGIYVKEAAKLLYKYRVQLARAGFNYPMYLWEVGTGNRVVTDGMERETEVINRMVQP
jgi:hypothetical protein